MNKVIYGDLPTFDWEKFDHWFKKITKYKFFFIATTNIHKASTKNEKETRENRRERQRHW